MSAVREADDHLNASTHILYTGMRGLAPAWTRGPYEKQVAASGTPFQPLAVTLPNMMNHVHGARKVCQTLNPQS